MFIYFVLIHCDLDKVKLASFHRSLVENKSIRTIVQAAKNNVELGSAKNKLHFKLFFEELASIVGMDVDNILSAVSRTSQMNDMQRILNGTGIEMKEGNNYQLFNLYILTLRMTLMTVMTLMTL